MEKAFSFGQHNSMVGILNEPVTTEQNKQPVIIILNAGLVHHAGPHRMTVDMARTIAAQGYMTFRFDLSTIGDSAARKSRLSYEERAVDETKEAMDFLSSLSGSNKFIIIGLCTGADNAHRVAVADKRVIGCVFLDGYSYPTPRFYLYRILPKVHKFTQKIFSLEKWVGLTKKIFKKLTTRNNADAGENIGDVVYWKLPPKEQAAKEYAELINRNVCLYFVFTEEQILSFNYTNQIRDSFNTLDFGNLLNVDLFAFSDHTYTYLSQRELLFSGIKNWLSINFPK
jgi:dienelactone hydrolase family protein